MRIMRPIWVCGPIHMVWLVVRLGSGLSIPASRSGHCPPYLPALLVDRSSAGAGSGFSLLWNVVPLNSSCCAIHATGTAWDTLLSVKDTYTLKKVMHLILVLGSLQERGWVMRNPNRVSSSMEVKHVASGWVTQPLCASVSSFVKWC